jgi:hypothetical protein
MTREDIIKLASDGMTLRDYFAAKAMTSMYMNHYDMFLEGTFEDWYTDGIPALVKEAYYVADAMLRAREK